MKFVVDNQLPSALAQYLRERGEDCQHVVEAGLGQSLDAEICRYAEAEGRIIISKDEVFIYLANRPGARIRVVWVRLGNCRTQALLRAIGLAWPNVLSCLNAGDKIIEIR